MKNLINLAGEKQERSDRTGCNDVGACPARIYLQKGRRLQYNLNIFIFRKER